MLRGVPGLDPELLEGPKMDGEASLSFLLLSSSPMSLEKANSLQATN